MSSNVVDRLRSTFHLHPFFAVMHLLGRELKNTKSLKIALTKFYGVGPNTALRLLARFQIHEKARVQDLTDAQVTALTSYLSSPSGVVDPMSRAANNPSSLGAAGAGIEGRIRLAPTTFVWKGDDGRSPRSIHGLGLGVSQSEMLKRLKEQEDKILQARAKFPTNHPMSPQNPKQVEKAKKPDVLATILVENEARRLIRENIAHHRNVGSYKGRRHAMGYPVRGQRTSTNAETARKLNRIERRG